MIDLEALAQQRGYNIEALMQDPAVMQAINDPEIQALLNDPQIMYMNPGDIEALIYHKIESYGPVPEALQELVEKYADPEPLDQPEPGIKPLIPAWEMPLDDIDRPVTPSPDVPGAPIAELDESMYAFPTSGAPGAYQAGFVGGSGALPWVVIGGMVLMLMLWRK